MTEPAQLAFEAWQTTPHSELDGEHTLRWDDLSDEYRAAWRTAVDAALAAPAPQPDTADAYLVTWQQDGQTWESAHASYGRAKAEAARNKGAVIKDLFLSPSVTDAVSPTLMKRYALSPDNGFMYEASRGPWVRFVDVPTPEGKQP